MKKVIALVMFAIFLSGFTMFAQAQNENLTITTYYPAPVGVYNNLRLFPTTTAPACNANTEGTMYYDNNAGQNQLMICRETSPGVYQLQAVGASFWTMAGNNLYPNDTAWNVGIGTTTPVAKLQVVGEIVGNSTVNIVNSGSAGNGSQVVLRKDANDAHIWPWGSGTVNNDVCIGCGVWGSANPTYLKAWRVKADGFVLYKTNPASPEEGQIWLIP